MANGERVLIRGGKPAGRGVNLCPTLANSDVMDQRRKTVGRRIKLSRLAAGYRSQRAFAEAIDKNETSVARAETGDERVGDGVFGSIESGLGWPEDCISRYLATGDESVLPPSRSGEPNVKQRRNMARMTRAEILDAADAIEQVDGPDAADDFIRRAFAAKREATQTNETAGRDAK